MEAAMSVRSAISAVLVFILATGVGLAAGANDAALLDAARAANWASVRSLLSKSPTREAINAADEDGSTALHWAVRADEVEVAGLLIRSGADANAENRLGATPLFLAAQNGN